MEHMQDVMPENVVFLPADEDENEKDPSVYFAAVYVNYALSMAY